jgi:hypothetical protein
VFFPASFLVELIITSQKIFAAWQDRGKWNPSHSEDNTATPVTQADATGSRKNACANLNQLQADTDSTSFPKRQPRTCPASDANPGACGIRIPEMRKPRR